VAIFAQHFQLVDVLHEKPFAESWEVFICLEASKWNYVVHFHTLSAMQFITGGAQI